MSESTLETKDTPLLTPERREALKQRGLVALYYGGLWFAAGLVFIVCIVANVMVGSFNAGRFARQAQAAQATQVAVAATSFAERMTAIAQATPYSAPSIATQAPRPTMPPLTSSPIPAAAPAGVAAVPTAAAEMPAEDVPAGDGGAREGSYRVVSQEARVPLKVLSVEQTSAATILTLEYLPPDGQNIGIEAPGGANAFYLVSGGRRYALTGAEGIMVGSTSQPVTPGQVVRFTLTFEPLADPSRPFDLIEGEHGGGLTYWDVLGIALEREG